MLGKMSWVDLTSDQRTQGVVPVVKISSYYIYFVTIYKDDISNVLLKSLNIPWYAEFYAENSTARSSLPPVMLGTLVFNCCITTNGRAKERREPVTASVIV